MRVLHVIGSLPPTTNRSGSLQLATLNLCRGLAAEGVDVDVVTTNADGASNLDLPLGEPTDVGGVRVAYFARFPKSGYFPSLDLLRHLRRVVGDYALVHATGLFAFPTAAAARVARRAGVPYVVAPSGMGRPWALGYRAYKKKPYWWTVERRTLADATALHATSAIEADDLRRLVPGCRVVVVPNAVAPPEAPLDVARHPRRVVFLGRLHPIKGLDVLLDAMSLLTARMPDAELVIGGPDESGLWPELVRRMRTQQPRPKVTYLGTVTGKAKDRLLASAAVLALTSHSESFGMVVVEALAQGTPVVVSRGCPWERVEEAGAGRWVDNRPQAVADALAEVMDASSASDAMGRAARDLARAFTPAVVGAAMRRAYEELLA